MELRAFIGALLFLGIHGVKNRRKAWNMAKAQVLVRLQDLLTCQRFELIGVFLHVVTPEEEVALGDKRLRKPLPFTDMIKKRCLEYYQPTKHLCIDERMVKSKFSVVCDWNHPLAVLVVLVETDAVRYCFGGTIIVLEKHYSRRNTKCVVYTTQPMHVTLYLGAQDLKCQPDSDLIHDAKNMYDYRGNLLVDETFKDFCRCCLCGIPSTVSPSGCLISVVKDECDSLSIEQ